MVKKNAAPTFEEALAELEDLTRSLESGELTLDESINAYEKGMELRKICLEMLAQAEKKLEFLEKKENGKLVKQPIDTENSVQSNLFGG